MVGKPRKKRGALPVFGAAAAGVLVLAWFFTALNRLGIEQAQEGREQLEIALRRAAVACYATEGIYPPSLDYLTEQYGVQIDDKRYLVFYENFADNLMPDITVLERET